MYEENEYLESDVVNAAAIPALCWCFLFHSANLLPNFRKQESMRTYAN